MTDTRERGFTALVVGAGAVGARAARQLLSADVDVVLAERRSDRLAKVLDAFGGVATSIDPSAVAAEASADVAVLAHGPEPHVDLAAALVRRGIPVVSAADDPADVASLLELDAAARAAGVPVAVGAGFSPGFSCLLAAHAATLLDTVTEVHVARAGTGGPACAHQHHRALKGEAADWRDGAWVRRSAGSGRELCWFPDPIGGRDCYRAELADPQLLVRAFPGVERVTARLSATRRDRFTSWLPMLRPPHADGGPGAVRVEVRGSQAGTGTTTVVYGAMEVPSMAAGAVAAVVALAVAGGQARRAGAGGVTELLDPLPVLGALAERGVKAAAFTG